MAACMETVMAAATTVSGHAGSIARSRHVRPRRRFVSACGPARRAAGARPCLQDDHSHEAHLDRRNRSIPIDRLLLPRKAPRHMSGRASSGRSSARRGATTTRRRKTRAYNERYRMPKFPFERRATGGSDDVRARPRRRAAGAAVHLPALAPRGGPDRLGSRWPSNTIAVAATQLQHGPLGCSLQAGVARRGPRR